MPKRQLLDFEIGRLIQLESQLDTTLDQLATEYPEIKDANLGLTTSQFVLQRLIKKTWPEVKWPNF
jgi:hypothetical protein